MQNGAWREWALQTAVRRMAGVGPADGDIGIGPCRLQYGVCREWALQTAVRRMSGVGPTDCSTAQGGSGPCRLQYGTGLECFTFSLRVGRLLSKAIYYLLYTELMTSNDAIKFLFKILSVAIFFKFQFSLWRCYRSTLRRELFDRPGTDYVFVKDDIKMRSFCS